MLRDLTVKARKHIFDVSSVVASGVLRFAVGCSTPGLALSLACTPRAG